MRSTLVSLFDSQLSKHTTTLVQDAADLQGGMLSEEEEAAARLSLFEKTLLGNHCRALRAARGS